MHLEDPETRDKVWSHQHNMHENKIELHTGLDQFSREVTQGDTFSGVDESNQIVSLLNRHLFSLDWDAELGKLYSHVLYRDRKFKVNLFAPLPNNQQVMMYSHQTGKLHLVARVYRNLEARAVHPQRLHAYEHSQPVELTAGESQGHVVEQVSSYSSTARGWIASLFKFETWWNVLAKTWSLVFDSLHVWSSSSRKKRYKEQ
jgi:hypothetical protein